LLSVLLGCLLSVSAAWAGELRVDILDIGQGDSILIKTPAGKTILIDAGDGKVPVVPLLKARGVSALDLTVVTHPHADHLGGMDEVLRDVPVKLFVDNGLPHDTKAYERVMEQVEARSIAYRAAVVGQSFNLDDGARLEVLFPTGNTLKGTRSDLNSNSVVLRLTHQGHCMLFVGDAEEPTERALLNSGLGACDVLKVAHHGSNHSSTSAFLSAVKPRYALISAGIGNSYEHPGTETMSRLSSIGAEIHRTDLEGALTVLSSEKGLVVKGEHAPIAPILSNSAAAEAAASGAAVPASAAVPSADPAKSAAESTTKAAAQPAASTDPKACPFEGSSSSEVFHEAGCGNAAKISPANHVYYATREAALAAGKRAAGCCKP
jgi:beta-lactamase superfamily II metal-dependent hydrolase